MKTHPYQNPDIVFTASTGQTVLTMEKDEKRKLVYIDWLWEWEYGFACGLEGSLSIIDFFAECQYEIGISDLTSIEGNYDSMNDWVVDVWVPKAVAVGIKHYIRILPKEFFAELSAHVIEAEMNASGLTSYYVRSLEDALKVVEKVRVNG